MKKIKISKENLLTNAELFSVRGGAALDDCTKKYKVKCSGSAHLEVKLKK